MTRAKEFQRLRDKPNPEVLIIGGGINGVGLYRELALQGIDVYLVDRDDFCSGASAASSHMIHGGLRYLENGEFRLVKESLRERNLLLQNAPHYVRPLATTIPIFDWFAGMLPAAQNFFGLQSCPSHRGALIIKVGLSLYDFYTLGKSPMPRHRLRGKRQALARHRHLTPDIVCTATYFDAWISHPERLALELILDAERANAACSALNYLKVVGLKGGKVQLVDALSGERLELSPRLVVNASGAWVDTTNDTLKTPTTFIGGTKGSHLILEHPELLETLNGEMIFYENPDGRICIVFPYQGKVMAGSTDIPVKSPENNVCTPEEQRYILDSLAYIFPELKVGAEHVVFRFCGIRPLPSSDAGTPGQVSRDHAFKVLPPSGQRTFPLYALVGGKWTTFRAFAEGVADRILSDLAKPRRVSSDGLAIGGGRDYPRTVQAQASYLKAQQQTSGLPLERLQTLFARYGTRLSEVIPFDQKEGRALASVPSYTVGEVRFLVQQERVCRLSDLLIRRSLIAMLGNANTDVLAELAALMAAELHWTSAQTAAEIRATTELLQIVYGMSLEPLLPLPIRQPESSEPSSLAVNQ